VSDPITTDWLADGMTLHFTPEPSAWDFVGFHNASLARVVAQRHNEAQAALRRPLAFALKELARHRAVIGLAARVLVQKDGQIAELESQLGTTHELLTILQDAARPAAAALFNIAQLPGLDERIRETIQQTLAPLDAALAATKARPS
jgi:hypothetical protein